MAVDHDLCTWSDLPHDQCAHCLSQDKPALEEVLRWFDARYASQLACGHQALEGQTIGVTANGDYVCRRCGS